MDSALNLIQDTASRLLGDLADLQTVNAAKDREWQKRLWSAIEENGLNIVAAPDAVGGVDAGLQASLGLLRGAGAVGLSLPLAETILAGWMLGAAGISLPTGKVAFGPTTFSDSLILGDTGLVGTLAQVPFARECGHAALLAQRGDRLVIVLVDMVEATIHPGETLAGDPSDRVDLTGVKPLELGAAPAGFTKETPLLLGAAARSMQIAGALQTMLGMTTDYVAQRRAFERTLSRFQAVQHALAALAGQASVSLSAAASAAEALETLLADGRDFDDPELRLEIMAAKIRTASAAREGARIAHQLHGAIGVTREHALHRLTLRALAWRDDYGNETQWAERLGQMICGRGAGNLWPLLSRR